MPFTGENKLGARLVEIKGQVNAKGEEFPSGTVTAIKEGLDQLAIIVHGMDITETGPGTFSVPGHHHPALPAQKFIEKKSLPIAEGLARMGLTEEATLVENLTRAIAKQWDITLPAQRAL